MAIETRILRGKTVFNNWEVTEYIGNGSGGKTAVFHIIRQHEGWQEVSALKVINILEEIGKKDTLAEAYRQEYEAERKELCRQAEEELRLMSCLRGNPHVVEYYDFLFLDYQEDNVFGTDLLIRMEHLENLREEQKKKGSYSEQEIIHIGKDICKGLQLCHRVGIIHRDIKPANIFVTAWGDYKLGDFGIARMVDAGQKASTKMGTRAYAAPEQFMSHQDKYDERVDIYSLGLTLYELANGNKLPFAGSGYVRESEIQLRVMGKEFPTLENTSSMLAAVINKACAFDAEKRFETAKAFRDALIAAEGGAFVSSKAIPAASVAKKKKDNPLTSEAKVAIVIFLFLLLAVLLLAGIWWSAEKKGKEVMNATAGTIEEVSEESVEPSELPEEELAASSEETGSEGDSDNFLNGGEKYAEVFGKAAYVTATDDNVAVITEAGELYMWGRNDYGQVGCGNRENQSEPVFVMGDVEKVQLSENHAAALTTDGKLYLWGRNDVFQIGNGGWDHQTTPTYIMDNVKEVQLGYAHSGALRNNGDLYGWGSLGGNGTGSDELLPVKIASNVVSFAMNKTEGAAITQSGELYMWGFNDCGHVGSGSTGYELSPVKIMDDVKEVQIGEWTSAAIQTNGDLYLWGGNGFGQIGNGNQEDVYRPELILQNVKSVVLEEFQSAAVTEDGRLYIWGRNDYAQLGIEGLELYTTPQLVAENVESVVLGEKVSGFIKKDGELYLCGCNSNNQITKKLGWKVYEPFSVAENITSVGISLDRTYAVGADGSFYQWGE